MTGGRLPPDAGHSYLGKYGLIGNPWAVWLLQQSELLAIDSGRFTNGRVRPPLCPKSLLPPHRMVWRPGAFKCYQHDKPVVVPIKVTYAKAPRFDALKATGKMLDYVWDEESRRYVVQEFTVQ